MSKLLSIRQCADVLSVSEISVRRMIKDGRLQHVRLGRSLRVPLDSVEQIVKANTVTGQ
jgi:excisionase family DNA binding protein